MAKLMSVLLALGVMACLPATASAQDGAKKHGKRREALLKKFDKNGDGKLDKQERAALREFRRAHHRDGGKEGRAHKRELRRKILKRFDKDGDGKLNDQERAAAREFLKSRHKEHGKKERSEK
ncbi:MAG TPA: EF-hand domain-containing protein [Planctomycetota bacterium]|nr:EF-hand domain-containing protein [Planctomycetota bacterium]